MYTIRNINIAEGLVSLLTIQMTMFEIFENNNTFANHTITLSQEPL